MKHLDPCVDARNIVALNQSWLERKVDDGVTEHVLRVVATVRRADGTQYDIMHDQHWRHESESPTMLWYGLALSYAVNAVMVQASGGFYVKAPLRG